MSKRLSPAQRLQAEIDAVFAGGEDLAGAIEEVALAGCAVAAADRDRGRGDRVLGRERYARAASSDDARVGMRNGYCPTTVIILSRESDHASGQRFSDEDSVVDAVVSMAR